MKEYLKLTAKDMKKRKITKESCELERILKQLSDKKEALLSGYYYRPGCLSKKTISELEKRGFLLIIGKNTSNENVNNCFSTYICWDRDIFDAKLSQINRRYGAKYVTAIN